MSTSKDSCENDPCCEQGKFSKCNCAAKLKQAYDKALKDDGMHCFLCNSFCRYAEPNRCDGIFICFKCKSTKSWKLPKGKWIR